MIKKSMMTHTPRAALALSLLALALPLLSGCGQKSASGGGTSSSGLPKLAPKAHYKVGFSQVESNNPWRIAETKSFQDEAARRGDTLIVTDATGSDAKQIADINSLLAQQVDAIFLAPHAEKPLAPAVLKAKAQGVPVILIDRTVDKSMAQPGRDYVTFIGSDFVQEGSRVGAWLVKATGGKAKIIELEGTAGSSPAIDRKTGFDDQIKKAPGMQIVASQPADFNREKGRQVTETLLRANPDATVIYAHNDEMALGAIVALEQAGKKPGKDVMVVSINGSRNALQAILDGKMNYDVETNPRLGPVAFQTLDDYAHGKPVPAQTIIPDKAFDAQNARQELDKAY